MTEIYSVIGFIAKLKAIEHDMHELGPANRCQGLRDGCRRGKARDRARLRVAMIGRAISVRPAPQPSNIPNFVLRGIRLPLSAARSPSSAQGGTRWSGGAHVLSWAIQ
jgi:hypothetical protein